MSTTYWRVETAVSILNKSLLSKKSLPYLPGVVRSASKCMASWNLSDAEITSRKLSLEQFQSSHHYQNVQPSILAAFLKHLYPMRNSLSTLDSSQELSHHVNHQSLFRSYCALPSPGVAHLNYETFEDFMHQIFAYRKFSKVNTLSGTTLVLYPDEYILKAFIDAQSKRQAHLEVLWKITHDLEASGIPVSSHERSNIIFKTFFKDRPDILAKIESIATTNNTIDSELKTKVLETMRSDVFDFDTYKDILSKFESKLDSDTWDTLLFVALRNQNFEAVADIMAKFPRSQFSRTTYKILIENLSYLFREQDWLNILERLCTHHICMVDIELLNVIITSLLNFGYADLASSTLQTLEISAERGLSEDELYLKHISIGDKINYSQSLMRYDRLQSRPSINIYPTELTLSPFIKYYCDKGGDFNGIKNIMFLAEHKWNLPISSQMFKFVFHAFEVQKFTQLEDLQFTIGKLIEFHDTNPSNSDSWVKERIEGSQLPNNLAQFLSKELANFTSISTSKERSKYTKLSSALMTCVMQALLKTLHSHPDLRMQVLEIHGDMNNEIKSAITRHKTLRSARVLSQREELIYIKKMALLRIMDLLQSACN